MKFFNSITDKRTGESKVWVHHGDLVFKGTSYCQDGDEWSEFTGCQFAELKATRKAFKFELKQAKLKYKELEKFVKAIEQYKNFNKEDGTAKAMYRQLNRKKKEIERIKKDLNDVNQIIVARVRSLKALQEKRIAKNS